MHGKFPQILTDKLLGTEATRLYNDAQQMIEKIIAEKWFTAEAVIGFGRPKVIMRIASSYKPIKVK
jgi:cobalamin-dependent methionine synthase I